jgi:Tol biopolymer transport system component
MGGQNGTGAAGTGAEAGNAGSPNLGGDPNTCDAECMTPPADAGSIHPSISGDGKVVAFQSGVKVKRINLSQVELVGTYDIFVRDVETGATRRASLTEGGGQGNSHSENPSISGDGRFVAFTSKASNLVAGDTNGVVDVFVRDLEKNTTARVSVNDDGIQADMDSASPSISANGRYVAFSSLATNLVTDDTNGDEISSEGEDVFVHDLALHVTRRVSVSSSGAQADGLSRHPSLSADGLFVAFESYATNLVEDDDNGVTDVFVRGLESESTQRVSVSDGEVEANSDSLQPSISSDGGFVAFYSGDVNLASGEPDSAGGVFVRDLGSESTRKVSVSYDGTAVSFPALYPSISGDGRFVVFGSRAENLTTGDTNEQVDFFVRDRSDVSSTQRLIASEADEGTSEGCISSDGSAVALVTNAPTGVVEVVVVPGPAPAQ